MRFVPKLLLCRFFVGFVWSVWGIENGYIILFKSLDMGHSFRVLFYCSSYFASYTNISIPTLLTHLCLQYFTIVIGIFRLYIYELVIKALTLVIYLWFCLCTWIYSTDVILFSEVKRIFNGLHRELVSLILFFFKWRDENT